MQNDTEEGKEALSCYSMCCFGVGASMNRPSADLQGVQIQQYNVFCCSHPRNKSLFSCFDHESSPNISMIIQSPTAQKTVCSRDDLLIFRDVGINEQTLVKIEIHPQKKAGNAENDSKQKIMKLVQMNEINEDISEQEKSISSS